MRNELIKTDPSAQENMPRRPRQIFSNDVRRLGGPVSVIPARDRDGTQFFRISHISQGGDCVWLSPAISDADRADTAADVLAAFVGGQVVRR